MITYWKYARYVDAGICAFLSIFIWKIPAFGGPVFFIHAPMHILENAATISSALIGFLGLIAAVVSFAFSAIKEHEFRFLRGGQSEAQFWEIFGGNIFWVFVTALCMAMLTFFNPVLLHHDCLKFSLSFLFLICSLNLSKFTWAIYQMIAVKRDQAR